MLTNGLKQTGKQTPRHKLMAMVHIAAQHLDIEHGSAEYRAWLEKLAGKPSCKELTDEQLNDLVNQLKQQGCLERKTTGSAPNRPTQIQESPHFLTRKTISNVIIGLEKWLEYKKKHDATKNINQTCRENTVKRALISHENEKEYDGVV